MLSERLIPLHNMGAPKLKKYPKKESSLSSLSAEERHQLECDKQAIKQYIDAIKTKLKSPEMAKKAAIVLENLLQDSKPNKTEKKKR